MHSTLTNPSCARTFTEMLRRFGLTVALLGMFSSATFTQTAHAQGEDEAERPDEGSEAGDGAGESPAAAEASGSVKAKPKARKRGKRGRVSGNVVTEENLRKRLPPPPSGNLYLFRPIEKESLKINI